MSEYRQNQRVPQEHKLKTFDDINPALELTELTKIVNVRASCIFTLKLPSLPCIFASFFSYSFSEKKEKSTRGQIWLFRV